MEELFTVPGKIRAASRAYRYMDFVYWACITDNFRLLQDQKQLSAVLQRQITGETLGRCLISGVVAQQAVFISAVLPAVVHNRDAQTLVDRITQRCTPEVYFALYDSLVGNTRANEQVIHVMLNNFRYCPDGQKLQLECVSEEDALLQEAFNGFNFNSVQKELRLRMRRLYPLLIAQKQRGGQTAQPRRFQNLFQVLNSGLDLDPVAV